jgi:type III secretory pathway lipoprotein EscJ
MENDWINVAQFANEQTASIAIALLNDNGIEAVEVNKKDSATLLFGHVDVLVQKENEAKALELLALLNQS